MHLHHIRRGSGRPLLLIHGLGSTANTWSPILDTLAAEREVLAVDLPGFGETPPLPSPVTMDGLAEAVTAFLAAQGLTGVDAVGSSMGARLVLELARRGVVGAVVSLDPGGFWQGWERAYLYATLGASIRLVRLSQPAMPAITQNPISRAALFAQLSARPKHLPADLALQEMRAYAGARSFNELLRHLAFGPVQEGAPAGSIQNPIAIGWGRQDRICLPVQAARAVARFPGATLRWFHDCGHFPHWDQPEETARFILASTGESLLERCSAAMLRDKGAGALSSEVLKGLDE